MRQKKEAGSGAASQKKEAGSGAAPQKKEAGSGAAPQKKEAGSGAAPQAAGGLFKELTDMQTMKLAELRSVISSVVAVVPWQLTRARTTAAHSPCCAGCLSAGLCQAAELGSVALSLQKYRHLIC
jgi:hypothetical protein